MRTKVTVGIAIDEQLLEDITDLAYEEHISRSALITIAIQDLLDSLIDLEPTELIKMFVKNPNSLTRTQTSRVVKYIRRHDPNFDPAPNEKYKSEYYLQLDKQYGTPLSVIAERLDEKEREKETKAPEYERWFKR